MNVESLSSLLNETLAEKLGLTLLWHDRVVYEDGASGTNFLTAVVVVSHQMMILLYKASPRRSSAHSSPLFSCFLHQCGYRVIRKGWLSWL